MLTSRWYKHVIITKDMQCQTHSNCSINIPWSYFQWSYHNCCGIMWPQTSTKLTGYFIVINFWFSANLKVNIQNLNLFFFFFSLNLFWSTDQNFMESISSVVDRKQDLVIWNQLLASPQTDRNTAAPAKSSSITIIQ